MGLVSSSALPSAQDWALCSLWGEERFVNPGMGVGEGEVGGRGSVLSPLLTSHLLSTYYLLGPVLGPRDTPVSKKLAF